MAEQNASTIVNAPAHQVFQLWSHFNDFPKFMSHVKEVTYLDDERSHWAVDVVGTHEWDAVNESWVPDKQIGWRSLDGLENAGRVTFESLGDNQTRLSVHITYNPPAGILGDAVAALGANRHFENKLQDDLNHFAEMVAQAPPGALDPTSSNYLFHSDSAVGKGEATPAQEAAMNEDEESVLSTDPATRTQSTIY